MVIVTCRDTMTGLSEFANSARENKLLITSWISKQRTLQKMSWHPGFENHSEPLTKNILIWDIQYIYICDMCMFPIYETKRSSFHLCVSFHQKFRLQNEIKENKTRCLRSSVCLVVGIGWCWILAGAMMFFNGWAQKIHETSIIFFSHFQGDDFLGVCS